MRDGQNLISWRWSLPLPTNSVWWGLMHAISSYCGNRPTNKQTERGSYNTLHRSFASVQRNKQNAPLTNRVSESIMEPPSNCICKSTLTLNLTLMLCGLDYHEMVSSLGHVTPFTEFCENQPSSFSVILLTKQLTN